METGPIWSQLLIQVLLIAANAFFASTEIAVLSLNDSKIKHFADDNDVIARRLIQMKEKPEGFLSTIQVGITLAGFLGSAFAASNFADRLSNALIETGSVSFVSAHVVNTLCVIAVTLILSFFTLVFGELVPKRIAMMRPEKVARDSCKAIGVVSRIVKPVIWLLAVSTNGVMRLIGINPKQDQDGVTEDEIRMMVDIGEEEGAIAANEREMIENIFEFNNSSAEDVMTHRTDVTAIWISDPPEAIVSTIEESGLSRFPVYDEDLDDIIGVLSTREYLLNERRKAPLPLKAILRPAVFVPESVRTDVLFRSMQKNKTHIVIVVDEYGGTSGIITMEDLLEEIVGNIYDEFDPQAIQDIEQIGENLWRVSGGVELETLSRAIGVEIPETDEFDTVGGLIFSQMVSIPEDGSQPEFDVCGMHIKVVELVDRRVEWAEISKIMPESVENTQDYAEDD